MTHFFAELRNSYEKNTQIHKSLSKNGVVILLSRIKILPKHKKCSYFTCQLSQIPRLLSLIDFFVSQLCQNDTELGHIYYYFTLHTHHTDTQTQVTWVVYVNSSVYTIKLSFFVYFVLQYDIFYHTTYFWDILHILTYWYSTDTHEL